ncbi:Uncharacterized protein conserved in bacteria [Streptococcus porcinus]|uniref:DUF1273 domain-containing protein n=1 Tax=Streptococcus porcinus TaxID=1340 RepID=UPI0010CAB39E|nr:DUF1273 domain-containing protein [Streptococcus porcinus]VTS41665.1 Uncharacterized protein conserved in bacteria [Streptococcus porcinus]
MTAILVTGYKSFELGIFRDKDERIGIIKKALKKDLIRLVDDGADWFILTGSLGFEVWALDVLKDMKKNYPIKIATLFDFETHGSHWNEQNQEKLKLFKEVDFVKYCFPNYQSPAQFKQYNQFLIDNTDGAYLFYDSENETNLKYFVTQLEEKSHYGLVFLTFDRLNEVIEEE